MPNFVKTGQYLAGYNVYNAVHGYTDMHMDKIVNCFSVKYNFLALGKQ